MSVNSAQEIASQIDPSYRTRGNKYDCRCPLGASNHKNGDKSKSFTIEDADNPFGIIWNCQVCNQSELTNYLLDQGIIQKPPRTDAKSGISKKPIVSDAERQFREKREAVRVAKEAKNKANAGKDEDDGRMVVVFDSFFNDEQDQPYVKETRYSFENNPSKKVPVPYRFEGGEWVKGLNDWFVPLQNIKQVLEAAKQNRIIYLVEGPKKAAILRAQGMFATCCLGGSKKPWDDRWTLSMLGAKDVIVITDNDDTGRKWGLEVCKNLFAADIKCRLVNMDMLPNKGDDVEQFLELYSVGQLLQLCKSTEPFTLDVMPPSEIALTFDTFSNTDLANGERLAKRFGRDLLWTPEAGWYYWDGRHYVENNFLPMRAAKQSAKMIFKEAEEATGNNQKRLLQWAKASESIGKLKSAIELAKDEPGMSCSALDMDADDLILNVQNGLLSLQERRLLKHNRNYQCSKISPVKYDPKAKCPVFDKYLDRITDGNSDKAAFLLRALGYSMTGLTGEECFFFLHGHGRNGKSKLIEIFYALMGGYASSIPTEVLMAQNIKNSANYELAGLPNKRFVMASETEQGQRLAEAFVKRITGGGTLTCRNLGLPFFNFKPKFKLWIDGNFKPQIKGSDPAIKDRLILIPFDVYIPPDERDPMLLQKFLGEISGILNRCLDGLEDYLARSGGTKKGLFPDESTLKRSKEYFEDQDPVGQFIREKCVTDSISYITRGKDLYKAYAAFCEIENEQKLFLSDRQFYEQIEAKPGIRGGRNNNGKYFRGIMLRSAYAAPSASDDSFDGAA